MIMFKLYFISGLNLYKYFILIYLNNVYVDKDIDLVKLFKVKRVLNKKVVLKNRIKIMVTEYLIR